MARSPNRTESVYFLGAGFSKAFGLPNTAELLTEAHNLASENQHWGISKNLNARLLEAYKYFYPDEGSNFRPPVGDFFTVLSTYMDVGEGLPQGFSDSKLLDELKFVIANIICNRLKHVDENLKDNHEQLDAIIQPGNTVITSNWDYLIERACVQRNVPFRLRRGESGSALTILKLHGSIDWTLKDNSKKPWGKSNYYSLYDLIAEVSRHKNISGDKIGRCLAIETPTRGYQLVKGATSHPYMLTMARGKSESIAPLQEIWVDAYSALSRASSLEIIGYSLPDDDVEIRTLLRAGVRRGSRFPKVSVVNPAPDVHVRVRQQIHSKISSNYASVSCL